MIIFMVGDGFAGKTSLWHWHEFGIPYPLYTPTLFEWYDISVPVNGKVYSVQLWESSGQEDHGRVRPFNYQGVDATIVMFSVVDWVSFVNIKEKWISEVRHHCPNTPVFLVGNKIDLRNDPETLEFLKKCKERPITTKDGELLGKEINAVKYMECSSITGAGVSDVFEEIVWWWENNSRLLQLKNILKKSKKTKKRKSCVLLSNHFGDVIDPPVVQYPASYMIK